MTRLIWTGKRIYWLGRKNYWRCIKRIFKGKGLTL
jgi:hypothetical protein